MARKVLLGGIVGAIIGVLAYGVLGVVTANAETQRKIAVKTCPEDAVHVGVGDYERGEWSRYACIPLDDIGAGKGSWNQDDVRKWVRRHR